MVTRVSAKDVHIIILFTWGDDQGQARDGGRLRDFASWGSGFLWSLQLVGDPSGRPSSEGRPSARAVAPEPNATQVGNHPV